MSQNLKIFQAIFVFCKTTPYSKIFQILFQTFSLPHWPTLMCWNVVKFFQWQIAEIVRYLPDKKTKFRPPPLQTVDNAQIASKICQVQPLTFVSKCSTFHLNRFTFGRVIAKRAKAVLLAHRVNPWFASNTFEANKNKPCSLYSIPVLHLILINNC